MMKSIVRKIALSLTLFPLTGITMAQVVLDVNEVSTTVLPMNSLFWDQQQFPGYEVPKGSGKHALFLGTLWFIGRNTANQALQGFAERYRNQGPDTWSGPLKIDGSASTDMSTVQEFSRVWKLNRIDIDALIQAQTDGSLASGGYTPPVDILEWPGNGPAGYAQQLAPYHDQNSDGIYNIYDGDYPLMKGERMLYWILNDNYDVHQETGLQGMGVEIHVSFYACKNEDAVGDEDIMNYTTFLEYEIFNRSTNSYDEVYAGFNTDGDLGYAFDDYTGCHVDADAFYFYNGDDVDGPGLSPAPNHYGADSPVQSIQFLEGTSAISGRTMSGFMYYANSSGVTGDPQVGSGTHYYNYLRSRFKDGTLLHFGGSGYPGTPGVTNIPAGYMWPGQSDSTHQATGGVDPGFEWSQPFPCQGCPQASAGDVRGVGSSGPFTLLPGAGVKVVLGLITTFDSTITRAERVEKNRRQNKTLRQWYDNNALPCVYASLSNEDIENKVVFSIHPNPAGSVLYITSEKIEQETSYDLLDINGKLLQTGVGQQQGQMALDVSHLPAGIYFVRLGSKDVGNHTLKFIKN